MNVNINNLLGFLLFLLHILVTSSYQDLVCPDKCEPCLKEAVVCTIHGRTTLPDSISSTVERLTIINQKFSNTSLTSDNFTQFAPPHISLKQLTIRHCNIESIEALTFSALTKLESMDLSNNYNLQISSDAFSGLKLRNLQMNNMNIKLGPHSFRGLVVTSLSLNNCSLTHMDYETLHPLGRTLSKLFLNNNHLKILNPKLQLVFQRLDSLDLTGNPFVCNCEMKWLINFYRQQQHNPNFNIKRLGNKFNLIPHCTSPLYVRYKYLTHVNDSEIICRSPHISELDIQLGTLTDARLTCSGYHEAWQAPLQISWFNTGLVNENLGSDTFLNHNMSSKKVPVKYLKEVGHYKCVINNTMGQASATVNINWPDIISDYLDTTEGRLTSPKLGSKSWRMIFLERRFTLLEILAAVTGTILFTGLLFLLIHKFVLLKCVLVNSKKIRCQQPNNLATVSLTTSYEPAVYSNSQTYDVPGPIYMGSNRHIASPNSTPEQFLDFKTQKKIYRKL